MRYTDPTGHCVLEDDERSCNPTPPSPGIYGTGGDDVSDDTPAQTGGLQVPASSGVSAGVPWWSKTNQNRKPLNCGQYCRAELGLNVGWVLLGIGALAPETAPVTLPAGKVLTAIGATLGVNYGTDVYGDNFGGVWGGLGKGPLPASFDLIIVGQTVEVSDWQVTGRSPDREELIGYLTGWSITGKAGALQSIGISGNSSGTSIEFGTWTTPQVGLSGSWNWSLPSSLPKLWLEHP